MSICPVIVMIYQRAVRPIILLATVLALAACADQSLIAQSEGHGWSAEAVRGDTFLHQVLVKPGQGTVLHVYLEGDGRPWLEERWIASDPTPDNLVMPGLMAMDPAPAIYLGRPCYFNLPDANCSPQWWTDKRYSVEVVRSLNAALDGYAAGYSGLVLIGHSGGGTLAMLLAARRPDVTGVVTLAGNLDTDRWAGYHDYTPLTGSLNPAMEAPLPESIAQWHYLGDGDRKITRDMIAPTIARQPSAELQTLPDIDHGCCWDEVWPELLKQIKSGD